MIVKTFLQTQVLRLEKVGDRDVTEEELKAIVNALPLLRVRKIKNTFFTVRLVVTICENGCPFSLNILYLIVKMSI